MFFSVHVEFVLQPTRNSMKKTGWQTDNCHKLLIFGPPKTGPRPVPSTIVHMFSTVVMIKPCSIDVWWTTKFSDSCCNYLNPPSKTLSGVTRLEEDLANQKKTLGETNWSEAGHWCTWLSWVAIVLVQNKRILCTSNFLGVWVNFHSPTYMWLKFPQMILLYNLQKEPSDSFQQS